KTAERLKDIHKFKQESNESLYQAWERYNDLLYKSLSSSSNTDGLAAIVSKLDNLGCDMKKLKENVYAIQVGCQICEGPHLDKECPLNEEVELAEEAKYEVKTLTAEVETKATILEGCKAIFPKDGTPLYTSFYYSPE
nr:hypothetical protein [Tanacetum cinerariifolium]